jgi:hypothetical protein
MELVLIIFVFAVGPFAYFFGADSRVWDTRDKRPWL